MTSKCKHNRTKGSKECVKIRCIGKLKIVLLKWSVIICYLGKYIFPSICLLWAFIRRFLIGKQDLYTYDNFSVTKSKYIMYTFQGYRFFYNNSVHPVICGSWYFTHKRKALPWPHRFTKILPLSTHLVLKFRNVPTERKVIFTYYYVFRIGLVISPRAAVLAFGFASGQCSFPRIVTRPLRISDILASFASGHSLGLITRPIRKSSRNNR
jgi:hypothetical protein